MHYQSGPSYLARSFGFESQAYRYIKIQKGEFLSLMILAHSSKVIFSKRIPTILTKKKKRWPILPTNGWLRQP